ncbi:hypothetical protein KM043_012469 [Ampulex compressa]|nr:hypothetical protein KM043_012469 [Ampulex compressa]
MANTGVKSEAKRVNKSICLVAWILRTSKVRRKVLSKRPRCKRRSRNTPKIGTEYPNEGAIDRSSNFVPAEAPSLPIVVSLCGLRSTKLSPPSPPPCHLLLLAPPSEKPGSERRKKHDDAVSKHAGKTIQHPPIHPVPGLPKAPGAVADSGGVLGEGCWGKGPPLSPVKEGPSSSRWIRDLQTPSTEMIAPIKPRMPAALSSVLVAELAQLVTETRLLELGS